MSLRLANHFQPDNLSGLVGDHLLNWELASNEEVVCARGGGEEREGGGEQVFLGPASALL